MARQLKIVNQRGITVLTDDESYHYLGLLDAEFNLGVREGTKNSMLASQELSEKGQVFFPKTQVTVQLIPPMATDPQIETVLGEFRDVIESRTESLEWEITLLANLAGELMKHVTADVAKACCDAVLAQAEADEILEPEDDSE